MKLSADSISQTQQLLVSMQVSNTGNYEGEEVVQLYVQDVTASLVRPVRELKAFQKIKLSPGESKEVTFVLTKKELSFYQEDLRFIAERGLFHIFIGGSSQAAAKASFYLR